MKKNMGAMDKVVRIFLILIIAALWGIKVISGFGATILLIIAAYFILTSFIGICPLYLPFGISTIEKMGISRKKRKR